MTCDVIITYCWNRVGYNILKSLNALGLKVVVADVSKNNICSMSKYAFSYFTYPDPFTKEDEFIETLLSKIDQLKPKILLPTHDESLIIAKYIHKFPDWLNIPIEKFDKLQSLSNKISANKLAQSSGIPVPPIYSSIGEIPSYPIVFKTAFGNSAKGVFFPSTEVELQILQSKYQNTDTFIQEKITGIDHSVDCIRYGNFFYASVYRAIITKTDGGGTTTQRQIIDFPLLINLSKQFLDYIDYNGVCGIDFKVDSKGNAYFIECNARYTGGLATPIRAGFDIPKIHYILSTTSAYKTPITLQIGTKTKWILGDIITLITRLSKFNLSSSELKQLVNFNFDGFDDYNPNDRKAFIGELMYYFYKLIKNRKLNP